MAFYYQRVPIQPFEMKWGGSCQPRRYLRICIDGKKQKKGFEVQWKKAISGNLNDEPETNKSVVQWKQNQLGTVISDMNIDVD